MEHTDTTTTPPPGTRVPAPLRRSRSDRVLAGVAAGIAQRVDLPPWLIRVLFIVLTIGGGFGIALYLAGWLLIPEEGSDEPIIRGVGSGAASWVGIALIAIAVLVLVDSIGFVRGDLMFAAVLIVAGVLLYRGEFGGSSGKSSSSSSDTETGPAHAGPTSSMTMDETGGTEAPPPPPLAPTPAAPPPPAPRPKHPPSPLGRLTVAIGLLAIGIMWLADYAVASFDPSPRHYLAVTVGIIGLGLLVSAFIGRARGLIVLGIFLVPLLLIAPVADFDYSSGVGERYHRPTTFDELEEQYELGMGQLVVDFRALDFDGRTASVDVRLGFGELDIYVPDDVRVEIDGRIGAGELRADGVTRDGVSRTLETVLPGDNGVLILDVDMNIGSTEITRDGPSASTSDVVGDRYVVVVDQNDLEPAYDLGAGTLVVDLSNIVLTSDASTSIDVGTGELRVIVPSDVGLDIDAQVGVGDLDLMGNRRDGFDLDGTFTRTDMQPVLGLTLEVGAGELIVEEG
jgi:phage shock protein PspC (stress-responsive transcriptional regulator)/predicted membrane protein